MVLFKRHANKQDVSTEGASSHELDSKSPYSLTNAPDEEVYDDEESGSLDQKFDAKTGSKRALKNRHLSLIALAGIIGPGILVGAVS